MADLNVKQAADYLGISEDTVYRMSRKKELPHYKIRSMYRYERWALDEWKKRQSLNVLQASIS
ncbi:helix-turn-helix domain-containing protein [Terribacillus saccharophilus]|uniref:helix-turn-helix domain-containing protein n=1 Tax=Terribacillus saccharophilus TaxID=361277 RepID=UPI003D2AF9E6